MLLLSYPVWVESYYNGSGPDPLWRAPDSNGTCDSPVCVDADNAQRWYGMVSRAGRRAS